MHTQIPVTESSQVFAARFAVRAAAQTAGFGEEDEYRAGIVATELASNLVKHARDGEVLVRHSSRMPAPEIELIAIDRGPGMHDLVRSQSDGHSTAGTSGTGLGAARRLSDDFDVYSQPGRGTVVLARFRSARARTTTSSRMRIAGVSVAKSGEAVCGDAWQVAHHADGALVVVVDGLGHGIYADEASNAAIAAIDPTTNCGLEAHLRAMHAALRHTRGAAGAIADIRPRLGVVKFAGVGNVSGSIFAADTVKHAVSSNGTLGHEARHFREYSYPLDPQSVIVMYSDGLTSHWSFDDRHALCRHDPALIAAVLYRDFSRQRDDVTVVVGKGAA